MRKMLCLESLKTTFSESKKGQSFKGMWLWR